MTEFAPYPTTAPALRRLALIGNPNTGKTTLFNRLCGMRARTANYPGVTADAWIGRLAVGSELLVEITDLPGLYGLDLSLPEADLCRRALAGELRGRAAPEALLVVLDASNLRRSLVLFDEARCSARPTRVALNMIDEAERRAIGVHVERLAEELGCPVVAVNARTGDGLAALIGAIRERFTGEPRGDAAWPKRTEAQRTAWAAELSASVTRRVATSRRSRGLTDAIDRFVVHPVSGTLLFAAVMAALFTVIFSLAAYPMDGIESIFGWLGERVADVVPAGAFRDFLVDGVIGGVAGTVVFLPQICLLFFLLTLLEDSGYLARAAFMIDGPLRRFGLPGTAFVPLLSSHACALPGIMAARLIADPRDRIATILVAPFMSCSARIPVYV
ncbi:MAG: ferrous iron transporter B, partial [Planctomycetes bacterium]|nr:ferrous iron transporter B [Planctomycetota bacterium]